MNSNKKWYIILIDSFIARAAAIFLFFLAIITGVKEFFLEKNPFIIEHSIGYFVVSILISIVISAVLTFILKDIKFSDTPKFIELQKDDKIKRHLMNRIGSSRSLEVYFEDEIDTMHKYTNVKRYDILDYDDKNYKSIRELYGINVSRKATLYIQYSESTEYKVSFNDIKIIAYDIVSGKKLKVECCHAAPDEKLNTHNFRVVFDKPLKPNQLFQIVYYIEFPHELECLSQTKEIMSLSLVRIKKKIENVSFYVLLNFKPDAVCFYSFFKKGRKIELLPQLNEDVREAKCSSETLGIREDILNKFPIDSKKIFNIVGINISKPKCSMFLIEYSC